MEKITSLKGVAFKCIYQAFTEAFADYEIQLNETELRNMLNRRGFLPDLSFAAFEQDKIVAFTLNGIGQFNLKKTAYDTGTGTLPEYRGQGLASKIFTYSLPFLKSYGIDQYLLEVLQGNTKAVSIYRRLGFEVSREFNYFTQERSKVKFIADVQPLDFAIKGGLVTDIFNYKHFCDYEASWQNSFEAIQRNEEDFKVLACYLERRIIGYCVFEAKSGDITQLAVDEPFRRRGVGSLLLQEALKGIPHSSVKMINTEVSCDAIKPFLERFFIPQRGQQYEMIMNL